MDNYKIGNNVENFGKRLFYKDLKEGMFFVGNFSTESIRDFRVCKVTQLWKDKSGKNCMEFDDGDHPKISYYSYANQKEIDGNDEYNFIYEAL